MFVVLKCVRRSLLELRFVLSFPLLGLGVQGTRETRGATLTSQSGSRVTLQSYFPWHHLTPIHGCICHLKKGAAKGAVQTVGSPVVRPAKSNPDPLAFESFPEI